MHQQEKLKMVAFFFIDIIFGKTFFLEIKTDVNLFMIACWYGLFRYIFSNYIVL